MQQEPRINDKVNINMDDEAMNSNAMEVMELE